MTVSGTGFTHQDVALWLESLSGGSTRVHVALSYRPPAGALGAAVAKMFGEEPSQQIAEDLQKFKQSFESGTLKN